MTAPSLPELQEGFVDAVLGRGARPRALNWIDGNGLSPQARLQIYRNLVANNLTAALATAFPAVRQLVGADFFAGAALRYISAFPPDGGNLQDYGAAFPAFLAQMPEARELAYIADVANLEWARQEAYLAADALPLDATALSAIREPDVDRLRFTLHPSLRLVVSAHPVWDIWMFCQQQAPERLELAGEGQSVAIWRERSQIGMQRLDAGLREWLRALLRHETLVAASERALTVQADFHPGAALHWLLDNALATRVVVS